MDRNIAYFRSHVKSYPKWKDKLFHRFLWSSYNLRQNKMAKKKTPSRPPPKIKETIRRPKNAPLSDTRKPEMRSFSFLNKLTLSNLHFLVSFHRSRMTKIHFRLTSTAQERLCLSSLICVCREGRGKEEVMVFIFLSI